MTLLADAPLNDPLAPGLLVTLVLGAAGIGILLPRPKRGPVLAGLLCGVAALVMAGFTVVTPDGPVTPEVVLFYAFAGFAIVGGAMMLIQRSPARAAISFTLVITSTCGLFLLQAAPFLMAATIIIYAGAIIVTFLFVLMMSQQTGYSDADDRTREPFLAAFAGFILLGALLLVLHRAYPSTDRLAELVDDANRAKSRTSTADMFREIGDPKEYLAEVRTEALRHHSSPAYEGMLSAAENLEGALAGPNVNAEDVRRPLGELADAGNAVLAERQRKPLPAGNVAALGTTLFSDYLLAVELGGVLLLVATIGAIAITHRRTEARA